jgi:hypothetical protein
MEKGQEYEVYYKDDTQARHKTFIYISKDEHFIYFTNARNSDEEMIPIVNIIRIIRSKENGKNKTNFIKY